MSILSAPVYHIRKFVHNFVVIGMPIRMEAKSK